MMNKHLLYLIPLLTTLSLQAQAAPEVFLWDNQQGLISSAGCEVIESNTTPFKVSTFTGNTSSETENLRNYNGVRQSHLINGSVVKTIDGTEKNKYLKIQVVGINKNTKVKSNKWFSQRLDKGYLYKKSAAPLSDYLLEVEHSRINKIQDNILSNNKSSFWLAEGQDSYLKLNCIGENKGRDYTLFRVYDTVSTNAEAKAFVGVFKDESSIFENIKSTPLSKLNVDIVDRDTDYGVEHLIEGAHEEEEDDFNSFLTSIEDDALAASPESSLAKSLENKDIKGSFTDVICTSGATLNVRGDNLNKVAFKAKAGERIKKFQSFGSNEKKHRIGSTTYTFVKVQFADREESDQSIGWVADNFIKKESQCRFLQRTNNDDLSGFDVKINGLDDPNCCEFPTMKKPTHSYTSGMRRFNAGRSGGRLHAAADLYRYKDEPAVAVAPGKVVRQLYYFYLGTYAIEVVHSGGFVVRYGEITGKRAPGTTNGKKVKMGQKIGEIEKITTKSGNCCRPMLHFELYSGKKKGPLTAGGKYQRRSDLMNPTKYLQKWQAQKF